MVACRLQALAEWDLIPEKNQKW